MSAAIIWVALECIEFVNIVFKQLFDTFSSLWVCDNDSLTYTWDLQLQIVTS